MSFRGGSLNHFGIQPSGNSFFDNKPLISEGLRDSSLAKLLSHEIFLSCLESLQASDLCHMGTVCRILYAFANHPPLWKKLVLAKFGGDIHYIHSWKYTYHALVTKKYSQNDVDEDNFTSLPKWEPLIFEGLYSDILYKYWMHSEGHYLPEWLAIDNIDRCNSLSLEEFNCKYARSGHRRPVILTDVVPTWKAYKLWTHKYLKEHCRDIPLRANGIKIAFHRYLRYCSQIKEEVPLYIFDKYFCKKFPELATHFEVPNYFREDLFQVFGDNRPDYQWLIVGPKSSGSFFHKDPNGTSAWNAVIVGAKKWILFPPHIIPPGVGQSPDGAQVSVPLSLHEWFTNYYEKIKDEKIRPIECICRAGEILYVPSGWWHMVVNIADSIAITQNFVSSQNLNEVRAFLRNKSDQISGFHKLISHQKTIDTTESSGVTDLKEIPILFEKLLQTKFSGKFPAADFHTWQNNEKRKASKISASQVDESVCANRRKKDDSNSNSYKNQTFSFNFNFE